MRIHLPVFAGLCLVGGCEAQTEPESQSTVAEAPTPLANASFNVAIESSNWGASLGRCEVQVAFYEPDETDGFGEVEGEGDDLDNPDAEDTANDSPYATVLPRPTEPGACEYALFDPDAEPTMGDVNVRGTLTAGDEVVLTDAAPITLQLGDLGDGSWRYTMASCSHDTFPFSRTFGLSAKGEADGVPAFDLAGVVAVGPDFAFDGIDELPDDGNLLLPDGEDFDLMWTNLGNPPTTDAGVASPAMSVSIVTSRNGDNRMVEALGCQPHENGRLTVPAETLAMLTRTRELSGEVYSSVQLDIDYEGGEVDAPWGELVSVRSRVSQSGRVQLGE